MTSEESGCAVFEGAVDRPDIATYPYKMRQPSL